MSHTNSNKIIKRILVFVMLIIVVCTIIPPPVYVMSPGETKLTQEMIHGAEYDEENTLYYTTVFMKPVSWFGLIQSILNKDEVPMMKNQVLQGMSLEEYKASAVLSMYESFNQALETAYNYLEVPYTKQKGGLYVSNALSSSKFFVGDKLTSIVTSEGNYEITGLQSLLEFINQTDNVDASLKLIVKNGQASREVTLSPLPKENKPFDEQKLAKWMKVLQFSKLEEIVAYDEVQRFSMNSERVGGASAGLVLTLSIIDALKDEEININKKIAATGTIAVDGTVGIIGGIEQKVVSVSEAGIDIFIVPQEQLKTAQKKAESIDSALTIIGVSTLSEAIEKINNIQ